MKIFSFFLVLIVGFGVKAQTHHPFISVKERLRISLWNEGVLMNEKARKKIYYPVYPNQKRLPEELLKPLMEFPI